MEIWSLTRFPEGAERPRPTPHVAWDWDDPRWPPIPAQDFYNLPPQQRGLHAKGSEYSRHAERGEGHLPNFERRPDRFLARLPYHSLSPALRHTNYPPPTHPAPPRPMLGTGTIPAGRPSPRRPAPPCPASSAACTRRASSTCASPSAARATSRTSSACSTASWPACPTSACCRRCERSTSTPSSAPSSTSTSEAGAARRRDPVRG